jgi:hypothetical protein
VFKATSKDKLGALVPEMDVSIPATRFHATPPGLEGVAERRHGLGERADRSATCHVTGVSLLLGACGFANVKWRVKGGFIT